MMTRAIVWLTQCMLLASFTSLLHLETAAQTRLAAKEATPNGRFNLTIDNIMRGPELVGYEPRAVRWSQDSQRVFFQWKQANEPQAKDFDTYVVNRDGSGLRKLSDDEAKEAAPNSGELSKDKRSTVFADGGDIFLYDHSAGRRQQLTRTSDTESNPHFTKDQKRVYFTRSGNLFVIGLESGSLIQLTDIRPAAAGAQTASAVGQGAAAAQARRGRDQAQTGTASQEFLKKEERELLDVIKRRAERREEEEKKRKAENPRAPLNLTARQSVTNLRLTPDERFVIASVNESREGSKSSIVPNYVTESSYTEDIPARPNVGDVQGMSKMAIIAVETGAVKWVDHGQKQPADPASSGSASSSSPSQQSRARTVTGRREDSGPERDVQLSMPVWSEDGNKAVMMARSGDNKDRWIFALDPETGKTRVLDSIHDDAWVGGPGSGTLGWLGDNETIFYQSERDGYSHLYTVSYQEGGEPKQLTSGKFEVVRTVLAEDKKRFFLTTSEEHPGERQLYIMSVNGGPGTRITGASGNHAAQISPDEEMIATIYSFSNKPPELYVQKNSAGSEMTRVTTSPSAEFSSYKWVEPQIVTFKARDGAEVYARLYKPKNFRKGGPAVLFVHGAGYLQNVHRWWSSYYREYMFHHVLMEQGYVVMDIDYRASAGYGRDWRTAIYRHMGGKDLGDNVDGARWLVKEHGVDPKRIGLYGGSYGGFITLMALFTEPDVFAAGAALRPVTDWSHYNHPYTSDILNLPQNDAEAYRRSSPIYFAQNLKGALLICHGMVDVNVHFQDTVRLTQRLIELRKENWEVAIYPVEDHGFVEPTSWADEYKRILKLFDTNLKKR